MFVYSGFAVNAVGYMLCDYCSGKIINQIERFFSDFEEQEYTFDTDKNTISDIAMGVVLEKKYWHLFKTKVGYSLRSFKKCDDNLFLPFTGYSGKINFENIRCIQVGLSKFFISDSDKKIYSRSVLNDLFFVRRIENKYIAYCRAS